MAKHVLIDLSLSTDDEAPVRPLKSLTKANGNPVQTNGSFVCLSDGSSKESPLKRLKTSSQVIHKPGRAASSPIAQLSCGDRSFYELNLESNNSLRRTNKTKSAPLDDIVFTSSAEINHDSRCTPNSGSIDDNLDDSNASLPEDVVSTTRSATDPIVSFRTAALLAKLKEPHPPSRKLLNAKKSSATDARVSNKSRSPHPCPDQSTDDTDGEGHARPRPKAPRNAKLTDEPKALRAREREEARAARRAERAEVKEKAREKRTTEREEKAREKQRVADLTEVNKAKKDKKETSKEMIIDLPMSIAGSRIDDQVREYMKNIGIETNTYQSQVLNMIRWRRKVNYYFDERNAYRITMPVEIHDEKHVMCLLSAKEFVNMATADDTQAESESSEEHVRALLEKYPDCIPIYLIEGLNAWTKKNRTTRNREYQAAVLGQLRVQDNTVPSTSQQGCRRRKAVEKYVDEDLIDDALLRLQVIHGCLVHHTATPFETAEWVVNFTQHISLIPYRQV